MKDVRVDIGPFQCNISWINLYKLACYPPPHDQPGLGDKPRVIVCIRMVMEMGVGGGWMLTRATDIILVFLIIYL